MVLKAKHWSLSISYLNLILSILVVALHINFDPSRCATMPLGEFYLSANKLIGVIADCAVPAFFAVSAFLTFRNYDVKKYFSFIRKKIHSLVIPYFLWSFLGFIYGQLLAVIKHEPFGNVQDVLLATYDPPIWFIRTLLIFVVVSPLFFIVCKNRFIAITAVTIFTLKNILIGGGYTSIFYWVPMLVLGGMVAIHYKNEIDTAFKKNKIVTLILVLMLLITVIYGYKTFGENVYYLYRLMSCILIILTVWSIDWAKSPSNWMQNSFFTFCMHALLLGVFQKIFINIFDKNGVLYFGGHILCIFTIWIITVVSAEILRRWIPGVYRLLSGNRKSH